MLTVHDALYSDFSARSRVRGHLEIYHAFLHDVTVPSSDIPEEQGNEDWEIINSSRVESPAQVSAVFNCELLKAPESKT